MKLESVIHEIRASISLGDYTVKSHAATHAVKEGFDRANMIEAILNGKIIEAYPDEQRFLVCGQTLLTANIMVYLHVVCEYTDSMYVDIVTAYLPDEDYWNNPPYTRRKKIKQ